MTVFANLVEADLKRGMRLMVRVQSEIDPQIRFASPEGDYALAVTLPSDDRERRAFFAQVAKLLAWKQALAFTLVVEAKEPNALMAAGVSHAEIACCAVRVPVVRPLTLEAFANIEWLPADAVGTEVRDLLPRGACVVSDADRQELERLFGKHGRFPLVHLPTKKIVGLGR